MLKSGEEPGYEARPTPLFGMGRSLGMRLGRSITIPSTAWCNAKLAIQVELKDIIYVTLTYISYYICALMITSLVISFYMQCTTYCSDNCAQVQMSEWYSV